ncbi:MAG: Uma2 family endonuclease [Saprospiraceae bacterium]
MSDLQQLDPGKSYTYADYLQWKFEERLELNKGKIFKMPPAPSMRHQRVSGHLFRELSWWLKNKSCHVFAAPFDVRLSKKGKKDEQIQTVVQPDLCVICDDAKLDDRGCIGSPDIIIEILSPGNTKKEMRYKFRLYEENKVAEYWVVFAAEELIQIYRLNEQHKYVADDPYVPGDEISSPLLPGFILNVEEVFV